jgi:PAS domain-containing protein
LAQLGEYGQLDDIDAFVAERVQVARDFEPHYMERTRANGQVISVEGAPLPQGGWVTVYTDITQVKRQEGMLRARSEELSGQLSAYSAELGETNRKLGSTIAALEQAKRELTEIEARTRLTTEMMPAHIAHVGLDRRYTYSNRRLSSIMPERPSDILGRHIAEALGAQAYAAIEQNLNMALQGQASVFEFNDTLSSRRIARPLPPIEMRPIIRSTVFISYPWT